VVLAYNIDGEERHSEIIVPAERASEYKVGSKVDVCYYVAGNGAIHIASAGGATKKIMYGYLAAIVIEIVIYVVIWRILL
jgi:hypothetical protein